MGKEKIRKEFSKINRSSKITPVRARISKTLYQEVILSQESLNDNEKKKRQGVKKRSWSMLEASDHLGKYLNRLRNNNK